MYRPDDQGVGRIHPGPVIFERARKFGLLDFFKLKKPIGN